MKNKKLLEQEIARVIEKINEDPKKAAKLITNWLSRSSQSSTKKSSTDKSVSQKTIIRKKAA